MHWERCGFVLAVGLAGLITSAAMGQQEKDQRIDLAQVPAVVKEAADKVASGVTWHHASKETEEGKTIYELTGKNAHGRTVEVEVTPEGEVIEVETAIPLREVPKIARSTPSRPSTPISRRRGPSRSRRGARSSPMTS